MYIRGEADKLRQEAKNILYSLLKFPEGYSSESVDKFVDNIISVVILEIAADVQESRKDN